MAQRAHDAPRDRSPGILDVGAFLNAAAAHGVSLGDARERATLHAALSRLAERAVKGCENEGGAAQNALEIAVGAGRAASLGPGLSGEDQTPPSRRLGVNRARTVGPDEFGHGAKEIQYGTFFDAIADIALAGGGVIRQPEGSDAIWGHLFPAIEQLGTEPDIIRVNKGRANALAVIPPPADLYARLVADRYAAFVNMRTLIFACAAAKVQLVPTVFTYGGGWRATDVLSVFKSNGTNDANARIRVGNYAAPSTSPHPGPARHQTNPIIVTEMGWDPFYWDPAEINTALTSAVVPTQDQVAYHRYALMVRPRDELDAFDNEASRRKCLAVAAFGQAFGEFLADIGLLFKSFGLSLSATIPWIECGNEMDACWFTVADGETAVADSDGANEYGRFHFLIATAIATAWPAARFSAAGLLSTPRFNVVNGQQQDWWLARFDWLRRAIGSYFEAFIPIFELYAEATEVARTGGFSAQLALTAWYQRQGRTDHAEAARAWARTCLAAAWMWPPKPPTTEFAHADLVHGTGIHFYHHLNAKGVQSSPDLYLSDRQMYEYVAAFVVSVLQPLQIDYGLTLEWALTETAFGASDPASVGLSVAAGDTWYDGTDELFQAGMLARRLLVALACGARFAVWHTFEAGVVDANRPHWTPYSTTGMRVDFVDVAGPAFDRAIDAVRRPSWLTFRRLSWLLQRASDVSIATASRDVVVVRIRSITGFRVGGVTWGMALVAWLDQQATAGQTVTLTATAGSDFLQVSLAPRVTPEPGIVDDQGFAADLDPDWQWPGWNNLTVFARGSSLSVGLIPAAVSIAPVPVLVFLEPL